MFNDLTELIQQASVYSNPGQAYHSSFIPRFKMYRKAKIIKQRILAVSGILAIIIVAYFGIQSITKNNIDIQTALGIENVKSPYTSR